MTTAEIVTSPHEVTGPCDRCGFGAVAEAILPSGLTLAFCGHHGRKNYASLRDLGAAVFGDLTFTDLR